MADAGTGAGTIMLVLGGLAILVGLVLLVFGPGLVDGGTQEDFSGDKEVTDKGCAI